MLSFSNIKKYFASLITTDENGDMEGYRQLTKNVASVCIANNFCCSSEKILVFRVNMDVFLELLNCGCFVFIQHYEVFWVMQHV